MAAKTLFVMFYVGAIEGTGVWLRPDQVTKMSDQQCSKTDDAARIKWSAKSMEAGAMRNVPGRWYAPNTREPIRDETLRSGLVAIGAVIERSGLPTTSSKPRYAIRRDFADLLQRLFTGTADAQTQILEWQEQHLSHAALTRIHLLRRGAVHSLASTRLSVTFPNGEVRLMEPGPSTIIAKAVIEVFATRFLREPGVIFVSESGNRVVERDEILSHAIGIQLDYSRNLPDIILVDVAAQAPKIVFVEVVATDGAITAARKESLLQTARDAGCSEEDVYFVTAFRDRSSPAFRKLVSEIAWGTFVWFMSEEEKILVFRQASTDELMSLFAT